MNIFFLDRNIEKCVLAHCDKHAVKMVLEYTQLLSSVHSTLGSDNPKLYKLTHKNHPCAVWARTSLENYEYLLSLAVLLSEEYTFRYAKVHKCYEVIASLGIPDLPSLGFSEPPKCVHDDFKKMDDTVEAYRAYYCRDKAYFCVWKNRPTPDWFKPVVIST